MREGQQLPTEAKSTILICSENCFLSSQAARSIRFFLAGKWMDTVAPNGVCVWNRTGQHQVKQKVFLKRGDPEDVLNLARAVTTVSNHRKLFFGDVLRRFWVFGHLQECKS